MRTLLLAAAASLALISCSEGADTGNGSGTGTVASDGDMDSQAAPTMAIADYASKAAIGDMYEIESSRLASDKSDSAEVKAFATRMITDHGRTSDALKRFVESNGGTPALPTALDSRHQAMIDQLRSASGAEFDQMYMMQQRAAHDEALALHRGYAETGDNEQARSLARTAVGVIEQHHQMLASNGLGAGMSGGAAGATGGMTGTSSGNPTGAQTTTMVPPAREGRSGTMQQ